MATIVAMGLASGRQVELRRDHQEAVVVEVGAGLREYVSKGVPVLDGHPAQEMAAGARGQPLLPWPNRLQGGSYSFAGEQLQAPINEPSTGCAIHGLTRWMNWTCLKQSSDEATMALTLHPQPGYPFTLGLEITYSLSTEGLTVRTRAANLGDQDLPFGAGQHPYLAAGQGLVDSLVLEVDAGAILELDGRGLPTGRRLEPSGDHDFRAPRAVGATRLDACYGELRRGTDGVARVIARRPDGSGVELWAGPGYDYLMLFSGDTLAPGRRRRGLAVEPMTCPPNAFRSQEGLIVLGPGQTRELAWGMRPF